MRLITSTYIEVAGIFTIGKDGISEHGGMFSQDQQILSVLNWITILTLFYRVKNADSKTFFLLKFHGETSSPEALEVQPFLH